MPHKHKRKHAGYLEDDTKGDFNLPPEKRAKSLSVHKPRPETWEGLDATSDKPNKRRKAKKDAEQGGVMKDDTPKQFARLMAWQSGGKKLRKGLDDGEGKKRKEKEKGVEKGKGRGEKKKERDIVDAMAETAKALKATKANGAERQEQTTDVQQTSNSEVQPEATTTNSDLKIKPGEKLSDFALRVDQSLPLSNVPKHSTKDKVLGLKQKLTKHNRHLQRIQTEWRNAEQKIKTRKEDEEDDIADQKEEDQLLWMDVNSASADRKGKKRRKAGDLDDGDPWKALEKKRKEAGHAPAGGLRASDAVQAPPVLKPVKNMFREPHERRVMKEIKA